jgi:hypothetical protein
LSLAVVACAVACGGPEDPYPVRIRATTDGAPLPGAHITLAGEPVGVTGPDGILYVEIDGDEGASLSFSATCPPGHVSPDTLPPVRLRRVSGFDETGALRAVEREVPCPPALRHAVVVVRTEGLADLPVVVDGREVTRTDEAGVAHLAYRGEAGGELDVRLDTTSAPELRPSSPERSFPIPEGGDELYVWNVELRTPAPGRPGRPRPRPRPAPTDDSRPPEQLR